MLAANQGAGSVQSLISLSRASCAYADLLLSMQKRVHDYVVADKGTAQEALDKLIKDWTETFEDEGKL